MASLAEVLAATTEQHLGIQLNTSDQVDHNHHLFIHPFDSRFYSSFNSTFRILKLVIVEYILETCFTWEKS